MASCVVMNSPVLTNSRAANVPRMSHQGDWAAPHSCTWNRAWYSSPAQVHQTARAMLMPRKSFRGGLRGAEGCVQVLEVLLRARPTGGCGAVEAAAAVMGCGYL
jgi:hypothetical protein